VTSTLLLGSTAEPPESYLTAVAGAVRARLDGEAPPATVEIRPATLVPASHVSADDPKKLWGWSIFPPGFRAPEMMELARRQAWTLKPALLASPGSRS
jgi:hypothetical protein